MYLLGISAYYHDSAAALVHNGKILSAAQEERFSRKKHDSSFPQKAIEYCLSSAGIELAQVQNVVFYDKPLLKFERLLETYVSYVPKGFTSFLTAMPTWMTDKLFLKKKIQRGLQESFGIKAEQLPPILFSEHHQSHAASAYFPSPFDEAAVLCLDGVGEWATTSVWKGEKNKIKPLWQINFPHSIGLLYSAFTYYCGFKVNSGEYKLMGLAPYGEPRYVDLILKNLVDIKDDGTFWLNMDYFNYATGLTMTNKSFDNLFGGPPRKAEGQITQREMDLARSIQVVTEEILLKLGRTIHKETGSTNICLAGGVALNCVANGRLLREGPFKNIWIQPAAGDAGGAIGAALAAWYEHYGNPRIANPEDSMNGGFLGPHLGTPEEIERDLRKMGATFTRCDENKLYEVIAELLDDSKVIGWVQGRMEFGPRALGGRSIIGDPRNQKMQSTMNLKIKFRESFRPFAPAVLEEDVKEYFGLDQKSPYMLLVAPIKNELRLPMTDQQQKSFGIERLNFPRSSLPAITHIDYSARVQTVSEKENPKFYRLLEAFKKRTHCSVLINTSFNVRGEPIVCTAEDAYRCFMRTEMDYLVIENFILKKSDQKIYSDKNDWRKEFVLD